MPCELLDLLPALSQHGGRQGHYMRTRGVIHVDGGARDPRIPTMFQVADVDDGTIRWVNADLVTHIVPND